MARPIRSFAKAVSWRVIATLISMLIVLMVTGSLKLMGVVGAMDLIFKFIAYYAHERIWAKITWGRSYTYEKPIDLPEHHNFWDGDNGHVSKVKSQFPSEDA